MVAVRARKSTRCQKVFRTSENFNLKSTNSVTRFFNASNILRPRPTKFRPTFEYFFLKTAKLRESTGSTIRTIIVAVKARKLKKIKIFRSPIRFERL